jgi:Tol biopolymer transport system component
MRFKSALLSIFVFLSVTAHACGPDRFFALQSQVFRVTPDNKIQLLTIPQQQGMSYTEFGKTAPEVSPDQCWISFTRDSDVWLYRTDSGATRRATHIAIPQTDTLASVEVLTVLWSADSKKLLLNVVPGETECVDCEDRGDWTERKHKYGYLAYDVSKKTLSDVVLPNNFKPVRWVNSGDIAGFNSSALGTRPLLMVGANGKIRRTAAKVYYGQTYISADGEKAALTSTGEDKSYIAIIDVRSGTETKLTREGGFAEFQWPRLSPNKQSVAWTVFSTGSPNSSSDIIVDGRNVFFCRTSVQFEWADDLRLLAKCGPSVYLLNSADGEELGKLDTPEPRIPGVSAER